MEVQQIWESLVIINIMPKDNMDCCGTTCRHCDCSSNSKPKIPSAPPCSSSLEEINNTCKQKKTVRFDNENLVEILEFEDDEESKDSRKRYWEFFAIDRAHFFNRILNQEENLSIVLTPKHRKNVYQQRFEEKL